MRLGSAQADFRQPTLPMLGSQSGAEPRSLSRNVSRHPHRRPRQCSPQSPWRWWVPVAPMVREIACVIMMYKLSFTLLEILLRLTATYAGFGAELREGVFGHVGRAPVEWCVTIEKRGPKERFERKTGCGHVSDLGLGRCARRCDDEHREKAQSGGSRTR